MLEAACRYIRERGHALADSLGPRDTVGSQQLPKMGVATHAGHGRHQAERHGVAGLYRGRELSPVEVTRAVLARIDSRNAVTNAYCLARDDEALASAKQSEQRWHAGEPVRAARRGSGLGQRPAADQRLADAAGFAHHRQGWPVER